MLIKLAGLVPESYVDGPGIRFAIFVQGCPHNCEGCHNPETHDFSAGRMAETDRILKKIEADELGGMAPEVIGKAILKQLRRRHMRVRVIPRIDYAAVGALVRFLPEKSKLALLNFLYS